MSNTDFDQMQDPKRRQFIRFDPTFNSGHIVQIVVIVAGMFTAYSALKEGQATQKVEIDQVKASVAAEKVSSKESFNELRGDVKEISRALVQANQTLAVIQANQPKAKP